MRKIASSVLALFACGTLAAGMLSPASAQQRTAPGREPHARQAADTTSGYPEPPASTTEHTIAVAGQTVRYRATAGTIELRDDAGKPTASVFYVAYTKEGVQNPSTRPVTFAYNGGPGSSSMWLHMGALGPRRVVMGDTAHIAPPPYRLEDNPYTPLDKTDLVFIDPVGTGFSHPLGDAKGKDFWGVDQDVRSVGQFITRWVRQNDRWNSPRYLFGESYGTTRSANLVNYMQNHYDMDFNGVVLTSVVLDFQTIGWSAGNELPYLLYLPSYAAVAWYHHALPQRPDSLAPFLGQVRSFALTDYAHALAEGSKIGDQERNAVLDKLHQYTGLSRDYLDKADLRVDNSEFEKELMREHGVVIGRLDARFTGPTGDLLGERAPYDPQSVAISSAFASTFRTYLQNELHYRTERPYQVSGNVRPWDWTHGRSFGWPGFTNVAPDLAEALQRNPHLQVLVNNGYYDLATPFFATEYTMDHLGLPADLRGHVHMAYYDAGHMMYVHDASLAKMKQNFARFIDETTH
jgi:carboxypeptidase C (cathepsin A)